MKLPIIEAPEGLLFTLKEVSYTESPRLNEDFTVKGKVELLKLSFVMPIWVIARVTYPEKFWEEIIPIIGAPTVAESETALGGDFEIKFPRGFDREGEFILDVEVYAGPTFPIDKITIPPFPPVAKAQTTFIVAGKIPDQELMFRNFTIKRYGTVGMEAEAPVEMEMGDILRIIVGFDHRDLAVSAKLHGAVGTLHRTPVEWFDELLNKDRVFNVPATEDWEYFEAYVDIVITSDISPGDYSLYVKMMGITGGDIFTPYLENVITILGPPELGFELTKPAPSVATVDPGATIDITCPVKSTSTETVDARAKVIIYEGSLMPGHGAKIREYDAGTFHIEPGETKEIIVHHTAVSGQ